MRAFYFETPGKHGVVLVEGSRARDFLIHALLEAIEINGGNGKDILGREGRSLPTEEAGWSIQPESRRRIVLVSKKIIAESADEEVVPIP